LLPSRRSSDLFLDPGLFSNLPSHHCIVASQHHRSQAQHFNFLDHFFYTGSDCVFHAQESTHHITITDQHGTFATLFSLENLMDNLIGCEMFCKEEWKAADSAGFSIHDASLAFTFQDDKILSGGVTCGNTSAIGFIDDR